MTAACRHVVDIPYENLLKPDTITETIFPEFLSMCLAESGTYRPDDCGCTIIAI
jgi:hypothetical protein